IPQEMLNAPEDVEAVVEGHANSGTPVDFRTTLECDLCIATDLRFAGGNASSTLDEVRFFTGHGLKVVLLDLRANQRSGKPLSDRYAPYYDLVRSPEAVGHVRCTSLLVRSPSVACSAAFSDMKR